ncbi:Prolyl oligopeptidase family protein [Rickettsia monacensis]|uniref:Prolyl oligopeptidase family protein n=1 Tax=Rickettsia monacensis TaxID=109232 RepID=A0A0B7J6G9_9RICK|nr:Prolyl oligopeptidase family protein [Rickettsia monacensis IrR/Munich]CEO17939.1 Prolyl oligopeptidase family protein [Rickettsia monacensis]
MIIETVIIGKSELIAEDEKTDSYSFTSDPITNKVQAVITNYDKPKYRIIDNAIRDDIKFLEVLNLGELEIMHRTVDDKTWFVMFYSDTRPTKCYKYDRKNKEVKHLFARYKALEQYSLSPMNPVIIKSRDGLDLVSYITFSKNTELNKQIYPKNPLPLVLLVHDGPDQRDKWGMNTNHQWLANRGYAVLSVNFRGSEGFGKRFLSSGYGEWGQKMQDDLIDAVNWAIKNKIVEPKKIAIMGVGYGGYAALAGLTFTPELFACSVDIAGPPNLATISNYFI